MAFRKAFMKDKKRKATPTAAANAIYGSSLTHHPDQSDRELAFPGSLCSTTPLGDSCWVCGTFDGTRTLSSSGGKGDGVQYVWPVPQVGHSRLMVVLQGEDVADC